MNAVARTLSAERVHIHSLARAAGAGRLGACRGSGLGVLPNSGEAEATGDLSRYVHPVFLCTADTCASPLMLRGDGALGEESDGLCSRIRLGRGSAARKKVGRRDL